MSAYESTAPQDGPEAAALPRPDPALHKLDRFVGTWEMRGGPSIPTSTT